MFAGRLNYELKESILNENPDLNKETGGERLQVPSLTYASCMV